MTVLAVLLEALAAARRMGATFDDAWQVATAEALGASCDPGDWSSVLDSTEEAWCRVYEQWPQTKCERALSLLGEDVELAHVARAADVAGDPCRRCGQPMPPGRGTRRAALYCSSQCRQAWHRERARIAA